MSIRVISALALLCVILSLTLFLLLAHLSTWFLWELLPPGNTQLAVNQQYPAASLLQPYLSNTFLNSTLEQLVTTRRFAISHSQNSTTLVAVPGRPFLFSSHRVLMEQLHKADFSTKRIGLLVLAQSNGDRSQEITHTNLRKATSQTFRRLFSSNVPAKPFLVATVDAGTIPFLDNSLSIIGTTRGSDVHLLVSEKTVNFHTTSQIPPATVSSNELSVALPSHILVSLPEPLLRKWNDALSTKLGFFNTQPDLLAHLAQYDSPAIIKLTKNGAVISVKNNAQRFAETLKGWVQAEEAHSRQQKQAFLLPDGTLGYELAPGSTREVFMNPADTNNCRQDSYPRPADLSPEALAKGEASGEGGPIQMHYLWLCTKGSQAAFGSDQIATQEVIQKDFSDTSSWNISVGKQYLIYSPFSNLQSISATGTNTQAIIHLQLRDTL